MLPVDPALEMYKTFGVTGLFIFLYLTTVYMFIRDLQAQRKKEEERTERVIKALEASSSASLKSAEVLTSVKTTLDDSDRKLGEFVAFIKGRDDRGV